MSLDEITIGHVHSFCEQWMARLILLLFTGIVLLLLISSVVGSDGRISVTLVTVTSILGVPFLLLAFLSWTTSSESLATLRVADLPKTSSLQRFGRWLVLVVQRRASYPRFRVTLHLIAWLGLAVFVGINLSVINAFADAPSAGSLSIVFLPIAFGVLFYVVVLLLPSSLLSAFLSMHAPFWALVRVSNSIGHFTGFGFVLGFIHLAFHAAQPVHSSPNATLVLVNYSLAAALVGVAWGCVSLIRETTRSCDFSWLLKRSSRRGRRIVRVANLVPLICMPAVFLCHCLVSGVYSPQRIAAMISQDYTDELQGLISVYSPDTKQEEVSMALAAFPGQVAKLSPEADMVFWFCFTLATLGWIAGIAGRVDRGSEGTPSA